ncbi:21583_t:CDS:1, partial [Cetraspora pellucida]
SSTKLISVEFLEQVNNVTIGQLILRILTEWSISYSSPYIF